MTGCSGSGEDAPYVEYCLGNLPRDQRQAVENADIRSRATSCLDRCGRCYRSTFVVVDGSPIEGEECKHYLAEIGEVDQG